MQRTVPVSRCSESGGNSGGLKPVFQSRWLPGSSANAREKENARAGRSNEVFHVVMCNGVRFSVWIKNTVADGFPATVLVA